MLLLWLVCSVGLRAAIRAPKALLASVAQDAWEPSPALMHAHSLDVPAEAERFLCHTWVMLKKRGWDRGSQMRGLGRGPSIG